MDYSAPDPFIGREHEIKIYEDWLIDPDDARILHFYDAASEPDKKGGVGKTKLLQHCLKIAREKYHLPTIHVDFFSITDRNGRTIAERVYKQLRDAYRDWSANSFGKVLQEYLLSEHEQDNSNGTETRNKLSEALISDLQDLDTYLRKNSPATHCPLLVALDTFEVIQDNPSVAVFSPRQPFPDNYGFERIRFIMAGRYDINWTQPNWKGRTKQVKSIPLSPFKQDEMVDYMNSYAIPLALGSTQAVILRELTGGRPILLALVKDLMDLHVVTLEELLSVPPSKFEAYLVSRINNMDEPVNWFLLFMAHAYHRFNLPLMKWMLKEARLQAIIGKIDEQRLDNLPNLSFVRRAIDESGDFTLHDEMRPLIVKYCWENLDNDKSFRREVSRCLIQYYEKALKDEGNE